MDTSLANGFANLLMMLFMCEKNGNTDVRGVVEGDDGLFVMTGRPPTDDLFNRMGLHLKFDTYHSIGDTSFCGCMFDPGDMTLVMDPIKAILRLGWGTERYVRAGLRRLKALLRAKALSYGHSFPACPVISEAAKMALRVTNDVTHYQMVKAVTRLRLPQWDREALLGAIHKGYPPFKEPTTASRDVVDRKFSLSESDQLYLEARYRCHNDLSAVSIDPTFFNEDQQDYYDKYYVPCKHYDYAGGADTNFRIIDWIKAVARQCKTFTLVDAYF
jgi:hypothetical protein